VTEKNRWYITLDNGEYFSTETPNIVIGNIIIGNTYCEPYGPCEVKNHSNGEKCDLEFKVRGWTSKNTFGVSGVVKDKDGVPKFEISGKYTEKMECKNLETNETFTIF
jgi:oxysterol-binding protein 1